MPSHTCCGDPTPETLRANALIGACARAEGHALMYCRLVKEADDFSEWSKLAARVEAHGMGPLVYQHLKAVDCLWPEQTRRELKGLYLRHRRANEITTRALGEILAALQDQGVQALVLKGAALAYLAYPQPGLRPMRDIDLLVRECDTQRAGSILEQLGYTINEEDTRLIKPSHHHLPGLRREMDGMPVNVELHFLLFPQTRHYPRWGYDDLSGSSTAFEVNQITAHTLRHEEMLWHIYRHAAGPPLLASPLRFVWIADLASMVEKFVDEIDWEKVKQRYAKIYRILPLVHYLTPWSENVLRKLSLEIENPPAGVGADYQGWPRRWPGKGNIPGRDILRDSINPPEWWLRLFYGANSPGSSAWLRGVRHPAHLLEWAGHYVKEWTIGTGA